MLHFSKNNVVFYLKLRIFAREISAVVITPVLYFGNFDIFQKFMF